MAHVSRAHAKGGLPRDQREKELVLQYAELVFEETFGFSSGNSSLVPPGGATPPNLRTSEKEATIDKADQASIRGFLESAVRDLNLPSWMTVDATSDVLKLASTILEAVTDQWLFVSLARVYTPADLSSVNPVKGDVVVAFFTDSVDGPDTTVELGLATVYYDILPSLGWAKFQMRLNAYKAASTTLGDGKRSVRDDKSMAHVAQGYSEPEFARDFSYEWGQNPPDFVDDGKYTKAQSVGLGYFEDGRFTEVETFVRNKILESSSIPTWAEPDVVKGLVDTGAANLSLEPNTRSWSVHKYDKSYDDPKGKDGSFRVNGVFISYTSSQVLLSKSDAQIAYLFWLGETYKKPALRAIVYSDIIAELFKSLHSEMNDVPTSDLKEDMQGLLELLNRCGKSQFQSSTGYKFDEKSTNPPRSNGDEVYAVACFGEMDEPVTDSAIAEWSTKNIFRPDTFSLFSSGIVSPSQVWRIRLNEPPQVPQIQSDLNDRIKRWLTQSTQYTRDNRWGISKFPRSYSHPTSSSKSLISDSAAFYANGAKTEKALTVKSNMIFFVGVYYVVDNSDESSDSDDI